MAKSKLDRRTEPVPDPLPPLDISAESETGILGRVPPAFKTALERSLAARPELFEMDETALRKLTRFGQTANMLRLAFWQEYQASLDGDRAMVMERVYGGLVTVGTFYNSYLPRPEFVAWLLCRPTAYETALEEALEFGVTRLREVLELPILVNGKVDVKTAAVVLKAYQMVEMRLKGGYVQKIEQKSMNLTGSMKDVKDIQQLKSMEEIQARFKALDARERAVMRELAHQQSSQGEAHDGGEEAQGEDAQEAGPSGAEPRPDTDG